MGIGTETMKQKSISRQLVFLMVSLGLGFTVIAGAIGVWMSYSREMSQIEKRVQQLKTSYVPQLAQSLWVEAEEMAEVQLQGIFELSDMQYAEIERENATYLAFGEKRENRVSPYSFQIVYTHETGKSNFQMEMGKLNILVDLQKVYSRLLKNALVTVANQAFVLFCVASCMLFILQKIIVSPLRFLKRGAEKVSAGDFEQTIDIPQKNEFGDLAHSLENMRSTIKAKINEQHQANENLNRLNLELTSEIEERKKIEESLRQAEEKYRKIFENAVEGIFQTKPDGTIIGVNPTMAKMFGYDSVDSLLKEAKNIADYYVNPEDRDEFVETITNEGKILNFETQVYDREKEKLWVSVSARIIYGEHNDQNLFEGMVMDITARKEREKAEEKRKTAEAANEAKSRFLANMSHEIRTPMNAIIGLTDLALRTELTAKQADYLKKISLSGNSLLGIINDILDFSKIEAGKMDLEHIAFNLNEVLENLASLITLKTEEKGLELIFDIQKDLPVYLIGDPLRLGQVLVNLANNSVKFTEKGQIIIKIAADGTLPNEESHIMLKFSVTDSGIGMTKEQMSKLFTSFSQVDSSTTRKFGGTGLGLSISKSFVEMMGGEIGVESEKGSGSTFWFTASLGLQKEQPLEYQKLDSLFSGTRVLVVDDNATSREILVNVLRDFSLEPDEAVSGAHALEMIRNDLNETPYKLILMDWRMPGMDGVETAKRIKNHPDIEEKPHIIMLTAYGREEVRRRAETAEIDGFLVKPVNRSILFDSIMNLFGGSTFDTMEGQIPAFSQQEEVDSFTNVSVLLAEDNEINQQVAVELLESAGIQVDVVGNGSLAVDVVCRQGGHEIYDMVLMDIQMPEMDGFTATGLIREHERQNGLEPVPIIAITAHALAAEKEKCRKEGMDAHIAKPIDPRLLFSTIKRWVSPEKLVVNSAQPDRTKNKSLTSDGASGSADDASFPEAIAGVDLHAGLLRVAGNRQLYTQILQKFNTKYRNFPDQIRQAIDNEDFGQAVSLTHNLKGVAGNIGAQQAFESLQQLEASLKKDAPEGYQLLLKRAEEKVRSVCQAIAVWAKALGEIQRFDSAEVERKETDDAELDKEAIQQTIEELLASLVDYNLDALAILAHLEELTLGRNAAELSEIRELLDELEFDQAQEKLKGLSGLWS